MRDRDVAGRHGGFIAEGEVVLHALARSRLHRTRSVLIAERRIDRLSDILASFGSDVAIYAAGQEVMDRIVGFHIHRGILAFGERSRPLSAGRLLGLIPSSAVVVVLFGVSNHDNIGGVFRNAAAFGASAVLLDSACCDPLYRKAIRVSVSAALITPYARFEARDDPLAILKRYDFEPLALSPRGAAVLADIKPSDRAALLIGGEGHGLSDGVLAQVKTVRIPLDGGFDSLNLATTSGIVLHHLRGRRPNDQTQAGTP